MLVFVLQSDVNAAFIYGDSTALWDKRGKGQLVFYLGSGATSEANLLIILTYCGRLMSLIAPSTPSGLLSHKNVFGGHS